MKKKKKEEKEKKQKNKSRSESNCRFSRPRTHKRETPRNYRVRRTKITLLFPMSHYDGWGTACLDQSGQSYALRPSGAPACVGRAERESLCRGVTATVSWPPELKLLLIPFSSPPSPPSFRR